MRSEPLRSLHPRKTEERLAKRSSLADRRMRFDADYDPRYVLLQFHSAVYLNSLRCRKRLAAGRIRRRSRRSLELIVSVKATPLLFGGYIISFSNIKRLAHMVLLIDNSKMMHVVASFKSFH
jgi:hypothetical protein